MKKLMVAAAAAAMTAGAFATVCDDTGYDSCIAYDMTLKLKTLGAKKMTCKIDGGVCDDVIKEKVYFLDNVTRTFKGYVWSCEYACGGEFNIVLWDTKYTGEALAIGNTDTLDFFSENCFRYTKKANKVAIATDIETDTAQLKIAGINGSFKAVADSDYNFVKSISGNAAGVIKVVNPEAKVVVVKGSLCDDDYIEPCDDPEILIVDICECFNSYCTDGIPDTDFMVPALGTWKLKYNPSVSSGKKGTIRSLCPAWAF